MSISLRHHPAKEQDKDNESNQLPESSDVQEKYDENDCESFPKIIVFLHA
jgi:hypothetical protein